MKRIVFWLSAVLLMGVTVALLISKALIPPLRNPSLILSYLACAVGPLVLAAMLVSCSSPPVNDTGPVKTFGQEGGSAGIADTTLRDSVTTNATIVSLDTPNRRMVLKYPDGRVASYKAGPEVVNFSLLKVGDHVITTVCEEMGIAVQRPGLQGAATQNTTVLKGPPGSAGGSAVTYQAITGKVVQVDIYHHALTLQINGGQTRSIKIMSALEMPDVHEGDEVTVNITDSRAFSVQKQ